MHRSTTAPLNGMASLLLPQDLSSMAVVYRDEAGGTAVDCPGNAMGLCLLVVYWKVGSLINAQTEVLLKTEKI